MKLPKTFQEGIQFECQGSGNCCVSHGEYGYVYLNPDDRKRMAKVLGVKPHIFLEEYCQKVEGIWALKDNPAGGDCMFLKDKKCSIYEGRPTQCRTWPFWPEVLNARSWKKEVATFCPGIGKGKIHTADEIMVQVKIQEASEAALVAEYKSLNQK